MLDFLNAEVGLKTYIAKDSDIEANRKWYVVDAENKILGRLASRIAYMLRGKNKPYFSPHQDTGDYVVVINAEKIRVTGGKMRSKVYKTHSGYPGGQKSVNLNSLLQKNPERVIELAVKRMLPKNALGRKMFKKLKVYAGSQHPHNAQQPQTMELI